MLLLACLCDQFSPARCTERPEFFQWCAQELADTFASFMLTLSLAFQRASFRRKGVVERKIHLIAARERSFGGCPNMGSQRQK